MRPHHVFLGLVAGALLLIPSAASQAAIPGWVLKTCHFKVPTSARHFVERADLPELIASLPEGSTTTSRRFGDRYVEVTVEAPRGATFKGGLVGARCGGSEYVVVDGASQREPEPQLVEAMMLSPGSVLIEWADDRDVLSWTRVDWGHSRQELRNIRGDAELSISNRALIETTRSFERLFVRLQRFYPDGSEDLWTGCLVQGPKTKLEIRAKSCDAGRAP